MRKGTKVTITFTATKIPFLHGSHWAKPMVTLIATKKSFPMRKAMGAKATITFTKIKKNFYEKVDETKSTVILITTKKPSIRERRWDKV